MAVYLIRCGKVGPTKIGKADDPSRRLSELQVAHWEELYLLRVWEGDEAEEDSLQAKFDDLRLRGDWFSFSQEMLGDVGLVPIPIAPVPALEPMPEFQRRIDSLPRAGARIKCWRIRRGMSQRALAAAVNLTPGAVAQWEIGFTTPTLDGLRRSAAVLGVTLDELLGPDPAPIATQRQAELLA